jgi:YfiH family protein
MSELLRSPVLAALGVAHGFNLRTGGVSVAPYASFNLGRSVGDDPAAVAQNIERFAHALCSEPERLFTTSQVHGATVRVVQAGEDAALVRADEADALATAVAGCAVGIRVADCVPVLLIDAASGAVGAAHAGWRGVVQEVALRALESVLELGGEHGRVSEVRAAIFPHIRPCCFEVGDEVAQPLATCASKFGAPLPQAIDRTREKPHVNLAAILRAQLARAGVPASQIDDVPGCTRCEPERFFSFRREGQRSGRHIAAIVAPKR